MFSLKTFGIDTIDVRASGVFESGSSQEYIFGRQFMLTHVLSVISIRQYENYNIKQNKKSKFSEEPQKLPFLPCQVIDQFLLFLAVFEKLAEYLDDFSCLFAD